MITSVYLFFESAEIRSSHRALDDTGVEDSNIRECYSICNDKLTETFSMRVQMSLMDDENISVLFC